jgi:hypothetical protein
MKRLVAFLSFSVLFSCSLIAGGDSAYTRLRIGLNCAALYSSDANKCVFNPKLECYLGTQNMLFAGARFFDMPSGQNTSLTDDIHIGYQVYPWRSDGICQVFFLFDVYYLGYAIQDHSFDYAYPNILIPVTYQSQVYVFDPGSGVGLHINFGRHLYLQTNVHWDAPLTTQGGIRNNQLRFGASLGMGYRFTLLK